MSGHSKWSTIKHQKAVKDQAKGKLFSKLSKGITVAVQTGGGENVQTNYKLKLAMDLAKKANMPKENIQRAIQKGQSQSERLEEITYEGFGPEGVGLIIEATTDNRNRTSQELKYILSKAGGSLVGPGAVSFNFETKGLFFLKKTADTDSQILSLIDIGAEDVKISDDTHLEITVSKQNFQSFRKLLVESGQEIIDEQMIKLPISKISLSQNGLDKLQSLLESLEDNDDVQKIYTNVE